MMWLVLAAAVLSVLLSALLSAAEAAAFAVGSSRLRTLEEEGFRGAEALSDLRGRPGAVRASLLVLTTLLNACAVGISVIMGMLLWGTAGGALGLLIGVGVVLVIGQSIPRFLATVRPLRLALGAAPLLIFVERTVGAVTGPFGRVTGFLMRRNGDDESTREKRDVREIAELGQEEGLVGVEEHLLVERAFRLDELTAWDVMTPRVDIFAWKDSLTLEEIIGELETVPYSRVPVYRDTTDDISGILYVREAYENYVAGRTSMTLDQLSREPLFVPGSLPLTQLLGQFQARRIHMGIVADEFGGTDGLATLEDILEELVGEIVDETDVDEEALVRLSRTEVEAPGGVDVREINHAFNVTLPQLEHRSLNGFILEELGQVPGAGQTLDRAGVRIEILEATDTQVIRARLTKVSPTGRDEIA
jgi:CBS domain containing-hemolysin-like protein